MRFTIVCLFALCSVVGSIGCSKSSSTCFATTECPKGTEGDVCEPADAPTGCGGTKGSYQCLAGVWKANDLELCDDAGEDATDTGDDAGE